MWNRILKRGEAGQSIVILAFGFIALLAFVGIVTDISLMFVRYSELKRAVDSAAIAAAGQMQKGTSLADVELAARQFFVLQGMDPTQVLVETCQNSPDIDATTPGLQTDPQLCTADKRKLVRVTAQVDSPTVFLRLIGWRDVTLETSAISETAVLDVVIIMDVSESMSFQTTYEDWAKIGYGVVYIPPRVGTYPVAGDTATILDRTYPNGYGGCGAGCSPDPHGVTIQKFWQSLVGGPGYPAISQETINRRLSYQGTGAAGTADPQGTPNPAYRTFGFVPNQAPYTNRPQNAPRPACRVRFFPSAGQFEVPQYLKSLYNATDWPPSVSRWDGFQPTDDFYGCCNDPTVSGTVDLNGNIDTSLSTAQISASIDSGDSDFSDLICQPFKQAKDATRQFLQKIDFLRGDRVGFVTFGRTAFIIDKDGSGPQTAMIDNFSDAVYTLNTFMGVHAEPNFYDWNETCGGWKLGCTGSNSDQQTVFAQGFDQLTGNSLPINYFDINATSLDDYPVVGDCPFQDAGQGYPFSRFVSSASEKSPLTRIMMPNPTDPSWAAGGVNWLSYVTSYEYWASCRDGNVGAALREANNVLLDPTTTRRTGTVWVMVMLSDGASGASDPVRRNGAKIASAKPYQRQNPALPYDPVTNPYGIAGQYGSFGVCPYGEPALSKRGELTDLTSHANSSGTVITTDETSIVSFPYCSDEDPESRHSYGCSFQPQVAEVSGNANATHDNDYNNSQSLAWNVQHGNVYDVDILNFPPNGAWGPSACEYYDVDDYARDWADFIGLQRDTGEAAQLPTIFTIGFGIKFLNGSTNVAGVYTPGPCDKNLDNCLGEELLRYIADVGDNNELDTDYEQAWKASTDGTLPTKLPAGKSFGSRGPCEDQTKPGADQVDPVTHEKYYSSIAAMLARLPPTQDCGNYFNAPDQTKLNQVFSEIASRMFTRLAG